MEFACVADNLRESFRVLAASRDEGDVRELRGVSIASANVTFQMFNAAFLSGPVQSEADLAQRTILASLYFGKRDRQWAYWVCEDWMDARTRNRLGHFIIEYQRDALRRRQAWYQAEVVGLDDDLFDY